MCSVPYHLSEEKKNQNYWKYREEIRKYLYNSRVSWHLVLFAISAINNIRISKCICYIDMDWYVLAFHQNDSGSIPVKTDSAWNFSSDYFAFITLLKLHNLGSWGMFGTIYEASFWRRNLKLAVKVGSQNTNTNTRVHLHWV